MIRSHRAPRRRRDPLTIVMLVVTLLGVGIGLAVTLIPSATAESAMSQLELAQVTQRNCQVLAARGTTSAARARGRTCVADQQVVIDALTATQTPSAPPSTTTVPPSPTVSPTVSSAPATTPPAPIMNCWANLGACGYPTADTTGPTGPLTIVIGDVTLSTAGMVYRDKDVRGCVRVTAADVTIANSRITCADMEHGGDYVRVRSLSTNLIIVDTEIDCGEASPGGYGMAVGFANFTLIRSDLHGCENGGHVDANVTVRDSWIHGLKGPVDAHFDGFQTGQGVTNFSVLHSVIDDPNGQTSAIGLWDEAGAQATNILIQDNLLAGGGYTLYCGRQGTAVNVRILDNRFVAGLMVGPDWVPDPGGPQYGSSSYCGDNGEIWSGNVRDLTGLALAAA